MSNVKLIPIYNPSAIIKNFKHFSEGFEKVMEFAEDDTNLPKIFNELLAGELLLWVGFYNDEYRGFITTKIVETPFGNRALWLMQCYVKIGTKPDWIFEGISIIRDFAKKQNCTKIKFYTIRDKAWEKRLNEHNFKRGYQEFIMEV